MSATNAGAVYLDLRLNVKELQRGFGEIERDVNLLNNVFGRLQGDILRMFSNEGFAPVFQAFSEMTGGMNPIKSGLGAMADGFDVLINRVPILSRGLIENTELQKLTEAAMGRLTRQTNTLDNSTAFLISRLLDVPFGGVQDGAENLGGAVDILGEKSRTFGEMWREVLFAAQMQAAEMGISLGSIFGGDIPNMWQRMLGDMQGGWTNAWTGMKQTFHGIINRIVTGLNNMITGLNNFRVDIPGWMGGGSFGFNIPLLPSIPALARGGIVDAPTLAMVGENGREAVLPLENNTGWMADLANIVAEAVTANAATNKQGETQVNLYLDGMKVAEGIVDDLAQVTARRDITLSLRPSLSLRA